MTTLTKPLEISVLSAPIAAIDRRALSQAWYSALGFARAGQHERKPCFAASSSSNEEQSRKSRSRRDSGSPPRFSVTRHERFASNVLEQHARQTEWVPTRPMPRTPLNSKLARHIGRTLLQRAHAPARTTVAIKGERGRVHLMLQSCGPRLRIVAICPKRLRESVARAIDQARYALCT